MDVYASANTDLIVDINGYYASPGDLNGNTALGTGALANNTSGYSNMASGTDALQSNTTGGANTASGAYALQSNTTGSNNTASGISALQSNTTGSNNTASGSAALGSNTTGGANTAGGANALQSNTTGGGNTASGAVALQNNTTGSGNTATGSGALLSNTTGSYNTAGGDQALLDNTTGNNNVVVGFGALFSNTTGSNNIAIGVSAADNVSRGNNKIHIASLGSADDSGTIRIGDSSTQSSFFAAGIRGVTTGNNNAIPVVIDSNGQLGTVSSSRRFKEDIQDMGGASSGLLRLRPVAFRYQKPFDDGSKPIQYGLIAEEVEEVYSDLVAHSADGQIETVKYQVLDSMLLNELQKEHEQAQKQAETIRLLETRLATLEALLAKATVGQ